MANIVVIVVFFIIMRILVSNVIAMAVFVGIFTINAGIVMTGGVSNIDYCKNCRVLRMDYWSGIKSRTTIDNEQKDRDIYRAADVYDNSGSKIGSIRVNAGTETLEREVTNITTIKTYKCLCCGCERMKLSKSKMYSNWK